MRGFGQPSKIELCILRIAEVTIFGLCFPTYPLLVDLTLIINVEFLWKYSTEAVAKHSKNTTKL